MQEFKVYEAEEKTIPSGTALKKLVLQKEGMQYPIKGVTIWDDHPDYDKYVAGATVSCELIEKDSGTPNPNAPGKNYINRTVAKPGQAGTQEVQQMRVDTNMMQVLQAVNRKLDLIMDHHSIKDVKAEIEAKRELDPEDIPF